MSEDKKSAPAGDEQRQKEHEADKLGDMSGDPQRGGRLPGEAADTGDEPRPADDDAHDGIPSRSFNL